MFPGADDLALNLSILKDDLRDDFYFAVGDRDAVETLVNKKRFYQVLKKHKIRIPSLIFREILLTLSGLLLKFRILFS